MSAHYFDVIRFSYYVVFKAGLVCVCIYVFFTQKTKKEGKNVAWCGVDPVSRAPTCRSTQKQEKIWRPFHAIKMGFKKRLPYGAELTPSKFLFTWYSFHMELHDPKRA